MKGQYLMWLPLLPLLSACGSEKPTIATSQSLVMESQVLSAGIITDEPGLDERDGQQYAASTLYNQREHPVTLHYRFYWYDDKGLEILPPEVPGTVSVPGHGRAEVASQRGNPNASKVRLYLYL